MQSNKLRMAIRSTAALAAFGLASQAMALDVPTGDDWDTSIYGYARMNAVYDIDEDIAISTEAGSFDLINTSGSDGATGNFGADAGQTRIGLTTTHSSGAKITVEGDFRGGTLRLRQGYGEYMGVLMGQTWSNFNSFVGNTSTLDFDSLPGLAGLQGRVAQARYTSGPLSISLEENVASVLGATRVSAAGVDSGVDDADGNDIFLGRTTASTQKEPLPTVTARLQDSQGGMSYSAAVLVHQLEVDGGTQDDTAVGYATFVAGKFAVTDMISLQGTLTYSDGANSYLYRSGDNFGADSAYVDGSDLETISGYGGSVGAGFNLGGGSSINIGYGIVDVDWDDAEDDGKAVAGESETNSALMANYQWTPVQNVMMGVEFARLDRENVDGSDGDANRVMFAAQYNF
jgi:hypothetical protein